MKDLFDAIADDLDGLASELERTIYDHMHEVAERAKQEIQAQWPIDSGASRNAWDVRDNPEGQVLLTCDADYSSYIHAKGDREKLPIYIEMIPIVFQNVMDGSPLEVELHDATRAYVGKRGGKYVSKESPWADMTTLVEQSTRDEGELIVPTDALPASQGGTRVITPRRK